MHIQPRHIGNICGIFSGVSKDENKIYLGIKYQCLLQNTI